MKLNPDLTPYTKINWKWIKHLSVRAKTIKLFKEKLGQKLHDTRFGNDFLDITPKAQATKEKKVGLHQNWKLFCIKRHYQWSQKVTKEWEKIKSAYHIYDKNLVSRLHSWPLNNIGVRSANPPHHWKSTYNFTDGLPYPQFCSHRFNQL